MGWKGYQQLVIANLSTFIVTLYVIHLIYYNLYLHICCRLGTMFFRRKDDVYKVQRKLVVLP